MKEALMNSSYFGLLLSTFFFMLAVRIKARFRLAILNPLLVSTLLIVLILKLTGIPYESYKESANLLSYL